MDRQKFRARARELVEKMTIEEAASQLLHSAPAIERLGVPEYNWWNEALHGVGRAGTATVFPQAIAMAASFDPDFLQAEADVISTEARAKYNGAVEEGDRDIYKGLTFWSPNINIFRDPRWGRGHETYGEDPYLTGVMGNAFIRGLQGDGEYLKTAACAKHFAVHSGPEALRHSFDARPTPKDLEETYLPAFRTAVQDAGVETVMGAYNRVNGEPCCGSAFLLKDTLRGEWGFQGHVVSDCWAVKDFHDHHHYTSSPPESASLAVRMGCDLNCGCTYENLLRGLEEGLVSEGEIREAAVRVMTTRFALGMFDEDCPWDQIPYSAVCRQSHRELALQAAEKSMVLLKNDGLLPLNRDDLTSIAVIGPAAYSQSVLYGNYHGDSDEYITHLDGIRRAAGEDIRVFYSKGCHLFQAVDDGLCRPGRLISEAMAAARCADVTVLCVGLDETLEGEEGDAGNSYASGDKPNLLLPEIQRELIHRILALGKPVVLVCCSGSAIDLSEFEDGCGAILQAWYAGQKGGEALGRILFGDVSPSGKLPVTFYYNDQPMPDFEDYRMAGRTYKFLTEQPWRPFGFGLTYSTMEYSALEVTPDGDVLQLSVRVRNAGTADTEEVVQIYSRFEGEAFEKPHFQLVCFRRIYVEAGAESSVSLQIPLRNLQLVDENGVRYLPDGVYTLYAGGSQPDDRSGVLLGIRPAEASVTFRKE